MHPPMSAQSDGRFDEASLRRFTTDFIIGLVLFALVVGALDIPSGHAFPAPPPAELLPAWAQATAVVPSFTFQPPALSTDMPQASLMPLLAVAISTLLAFNLAVWRHLRSTYAAQAPRSRQ